MINEGVGDAVIDGVIPAVYSSILVLGATLYSVSLFALLLPICFIVFIFNYRTFVFNPAKKAHDERIQMLESRLLDGNFASCEKRFRHTKDPKAEGYERRTGDIKEYLSRIYIMMKDGVLSAITNLSTYQIRNITNVKLLTFKYGVL